MKPCPHCHNEMRDDALFCGKCGTRISNTSDEASKNRTLFGVASFQELHQEWLDSHAEVVLDKKKTQLWGSLDLPPINVAASKSDAHYDPTPQPDPHKANKDLEELKRLQEVQRRYAVTEPVFPGFKQFLELKSRDRTLIYLIILLILLAATLLLAMLGYYLIAKSSPSPM